MKGISMYKEILASFQRSVKNSYGDALFARHIFLKILIKLHPYLTLHKSN
jgi:hypothetical protein